MAVDECVFCGSPIGILNTQERAEPRGLSESLGVSSSAGDTLYSFSVAAGLVRRSVGVYPESKSIAREGS